MKNITEFLTEKLNPRLAGAFEYCGGLSDAINGGIDLEDVLSRTGKRVADDVGEYIQNVIRPAEITVETWGPKDDFEDGADIWEDFYKDTKVKPNVPVVVCKDEIWNETFYFYIVFDTPAKKKIMDDVLDLFGGEGSEATWKNNM